MKKKNIWILIIAIILIIPISFFAWKDISHNNQVKKDVDNLIKKYDFIDDYKLSGYQNSSIELMVNEQFNNLKFKSIEKNFEEIDESLHDIIIRNCSKNNIDLIFENFMKSTVTTNFNGKIYNYNYLGLKISDNYKKSNNTNTNYTFGQLKEVVNEKIMSYDDVLKITVNPRGSLSSDDKNMEHYEKTIYMNDTFFEKSVKEQYIILDSIYKDFVNIMREYNNQTDPVLRFSKEGNEYISYSMSQNEFELISYDKFVNRYELEEDIDILNKYDNIRAANGKYGGVKTTSSSNNSTQSYTTEPTDEEKGVAWAIAKDEVKKKLKSPSTAKFPFSYNGQSIKKSFDDKYQIISYVDAENSLGATVRVNFIVEFEVSGEETYKVINVTLLE